MRSDPRIGLLISLSIAGIAALWLCGQLLAGEAVWTALSPSLGDGVHAITFLSVFLLLAALPVALLFHRYSKIKRELLSGRNVIARWNADPTLFQAFGEVAARRDRSEKLGALGMILFFIVVIFGAFAIFDPKVAKEMMLAAAGIAALMILAFWLSTRVSKAHLQFRSGEIIVGPKGLLVNDVLHVWGIPILSWLVDAKIEQGPPRILTITYALLARYGVQYVNVMMPVPDRAVGRAEDVCRRLRPQGRDGK